MARTIAGRLNFSNLLQTDQQGSVALNMWFIFGIVSLSGFLAYRIWRKCYWAWGWTSCEGYLRHGKQRYKTRHSEHRGTHHLEYAVTCPAGFYFRIKRESSWDRLAKWCGLSVEHEFSDPDLNSRLYFASNDPAWLAELSQYADLRERLKRMFDDPNLLSITCEGCHLSAQIRFKAESLPQEYLTGTAMHSTVSTLGDMAQRLKNINLRHGQGKRDPYVMRAILLTALSTSLLMLGLLEMFRIVWSERYDVMVDGWTLFRASSVCAAALLLLILLTAAALLRGSSHAHLVMLEVLLAGGLGLLGTSYALSRDLNCELDKEEAAQHLVKVTGKYSGYRRRYGTYYKLELDHASSPINSRTIEVSFSTYSIAVVGEPIVVRIKPGFFGYRWIESIGTARQNGR